VAVVDLEIRSPISPTYQSNATSRTNAMLKPMPHCVRVFIGIEDGTSDIIHGQAHMLQGKLTAGVMRDVGGQPHEVNGFPEFLVPTIDVVFHSFLTSPPVTGQMIH
jgi:hypothetical protein